MEYGVAGADGGGEEIAQAATVKDIRLLHLGHRLAGQPCVVPPGVAPAWQVPGPGAVAGFSAVGWFTTRRLAAELGVPVGAVSCAWSGSNIRGWMSDRALAALGVYSDERNALKTLVAAEKRDGRPVPAQELDLLTQWWTNNDPGTAGNWQRSNTGSSTTWRDVDVPGAWPPAGMSTAGGLWLRREIGLEQIGLSAHIAVGRLAEDQTLWVNGIEIPADGQVPTGALRVGTNTLAIRVWSSDGQTTAGSANDWRVEADGMATVSLAGSWKVTRSIDVATVPAPPRLRFQGGPDSTTMLFNGGIASLAPFAFTGVVYYQGEQDAGNPEYYRLLPALIGDWRLTFAAPQLPFVIVQLPAFRQPVAEPVQTTVQFGLARDAQLATARATPHVGLAVTIDLGDAGNVHPKRKREVGERAAHAALATAYGRNDGGGPMYDGMSVEGSSIRVRFTRIHGHLTVRDGSPSGFALAGNDGVWHRAVAKADGAEVVVQADDVPHPTAVRYAWAENPSVTLYDEQGMPASPFRSDAR